MLLPRGRDRTGENFTAADLAGQYEYGDKTIGKISLQLRITPNCGSSGYSERSASL